MYLHSRLEKHKLLITYTRMGLSAQAKITDSPYYIHIQSLHKTQCLQLRIYIHQPIHPPTYTDAQRYHLYVSTYPFIHDVICLSNYPSLFIQIQTLTNTCNGSCIDYLCSVPLTIDTQTPMLLLTRSYFDVCSNETGKVGTFRSEYPN